MNADEKIIMEIHSTVTAIDSKLQAHINNPVIHQVPPCHFYKGLINRMWGVFLVALAALIAALTSGKH